MIELRWKLWEAASWIAWWLCPDKKALSLIMQNGTIISRAAMDHVKSQAGKEGK